LIKIIINATSKLYRTYKYIYIYIYIYIYYKRGYIIKDGGSV